MSQSIAAGIEVEHVTKRCHFVCLDSADDSGRPADDSGSVKGSSGTLHGNELRLLQGMLSRLLPHI